MANLFEGELYKMPTTSTFDLSHDVKFSTNIGKLVPFYTDEILPGDIFNITSAQLVKFQPLVHPIMSRMKIFQHFYHIPTRVMWHGWKYYIAGDKTDKYATIPYFQGTQQRALVLEEGGIFDYMGVTPADDMLEPLNAFPLLAYFWTIKDYYLDEFIDQDQYQLLIDVLDYIQASEGGNLWELTMDDIYGNGNTTTYIFDSSKGNEPGDGIFSINYLFDRRWKKDYFTSCLPFAQAGDPVRFPIDLSGKSGISRKFEPLPDIYDDIFGNPIPDGSASFQDGVQLSDGLHGTQINLNNFQVDLDDASIENQTTIKQLREAFTMENFLERVARIGRKYGDFIKGMFGVTVPDYTYDKAQYIGGLAEPIEVSEVLQTSETDNTALGERGGHAMSFNSGYVGKFTANEHGYVIALMSTLPEPTYSQGIPRLFSHIDRFDFAFPQFANLGEQETLVKELFYQPESPYNNDVFGYLPRFTEYKYKYDRVAGQFRSELEKWAITRKFENSPVLNSEFIETNYDDFKDIFAYTGTDKEEVDTMILHVFMDIKATRKLPKFGTPSGLYPQ